MKEMINYVIEANIALLFFLAIYKLFLKKETNFQFLRFFMLVAIVVSLLLPFVHLNDQENTSILTIKQVVPEYWLPEVTVGGAVGQSQQAITNTAYNVWHFAAWIYLTGVAVFSLWLTMQLGYVFIMLRNATIYKIGTFRIIESTEDKPSFSFFNLIYIGKSHELTHSEKEQIIAHEQVHARQFHSLDILLVTVTGIIFWFNPFIRNYKKIFIQLHEFEADARAVENSDVDVYCNLLARVALQAHFPIASHFNESLTVKRIEMMRTMKRKIENWKLAAIGLSLTLCFVAIACQDQITNESKVVYDIPKEIVEKVERLRAANPHKKVVVFEVIGDENDMQNDLAEKLKKYDLSASRSIEIQFEYYVDPAIQGKKRTFAIVDLNEGNIPEDESSHMLPDKTESDVVESEVPDGDPVFLVVEKAPAYPGGLDKMNEFVFQNLKYPQKAVTENVQGTVYVSFIVEKTGKVSEANIIKGISKECDAEALRVVEKFDAWTPGMQSGKPVRVRFVLPIKFKL